MSYGGLCEFCRREVNPDFAAYPITGWEEKREAGGANRVIGRERIPDRIAHIDCVERAAKMKRKGIAPGQEQLV